MSTLTKLPTPAPVVRLDATGQCGLNDLGAHLTQCRPARRALHGLRCVFEAMHQFVMPRLVSSVASVGASAAALLYIAS